jgi:hypothetical protein
MTDHRLVTERPQGAADAGLPWRSVVDMCAAAAGPFEISLLSAWRRELDGVQARVAALRGDVPVSASPADPLPVGVHALLTLAAARLGSVWRAGQRIDAAAAGELARRAVSQHEAVRDREPVRSLNRQHVLRGDWSITQAARLVADIGPSAYRVLVRGWGAAQLLQLRTGQSASQSVLFDTAISLGALTAGVSMESSPRVADRSSAAARVLDWASRL